jgi:serine/threonine protein kinase
MNNYTLLEPIGKGSFGLIRKVKRISDGRLLAMKEINFSKMSDREKRQLVSEVNILRELRHPAIVRYCTYIMKVLIIDRRTDCGSGPVSNLHYNGAMRGRRPVCRNQAVSKGEKVSKYLISLMVAGGCLLHLT